MGLNYINTLIDTGNFERSLLPKWAEDERLYNCEGNFRGLFREIFLSKVWNFFG